VEKEWQIIDHLPRYWEIPVADSLYLGAALLFRLVKMVINSECWLERIEVAWGYWYTSFQLAKMLLRKAFIPQASSRFGSVLCTLVVSHAIDDSFFAHAAELCALSEYRIYPGNGKLMIRRDGRPIWLGTSKAYSLTIQRKKAAKLVWTQAWRRLHKKGLTETSTKKRNRRAGKVQRAVVGASLEDIKKKAAQKTEIRSASQAAALKELKDRKAANKAKSSTSKPKVAPTFQKVPKHMGGKGKAR
jgi:large subunit ribosomal protein L24e